MIGQCLRCGKDYNVPIQKFRFCMSCRQWYGDQTYLNNGAFRYNNETKDRKSMPIQSSEVDDFLKSIGNR